MKVKTFEKRLTDLISQFEKADNCKVMEIKYHELKNFWYPVIGKQTN